MMNLRLEHWRTLLGLAVLVTGALAVYGDQKPADRTKRRAEINTERLLKETRPAVAERTRDRAKPDIESPVEAVVASTSATAGTPAFVNPKVEPGKVNWHTSLDAACAAAKKSGKPVLLFQMMGKLDDLFC